MRPCRNLSGILAAAGGMMVKALPVCLVILQAAAGAGCRDRSTQSSHSATQTPLESTAGPGKPPDAVAAPDARRTLRVPTRLRIEPTNGQLAASVDLASLKLVGLDRDLDPAKVHGVKAVWTAGVRLKSCRSLDVSCFDLGQSLLERSKYRSGSTIEMQLILFETDVPIGHKWTPEAAGYVELWRTTVSGRVP